MYCRLIQLVPQLTPLTFFEWQASHLCRLPRHLSLWDPVHYIGKHINNWAKHAFNIYVHSVSQKERLCSSLWWSLSSITVILILSVCGTVKSIVRCVFYSMRVVLAISSWTYSSSSGSGGSSVVHSLSSWRSSRSSWGNSMSCLRRPGSTPGAWLLTYSSKSTGSTTSVRGNCQSTLDHYVATLTWP